MKISRRDDQEKMNTPTCITSLPREILLQILTRLSPKSIVRFRCTSKFFYSFVPEPCFGFRILVYFPSTTCPSNFYTMSYTKENQGKLQANIIQCPHEVQCFHRAVRSSFVDDKICLLNQYGSVALCNLSTRQHIPLPWCCCRCAALGFDSVSKRYKLLILESFSDCGRDCKLKVLTLGVDKSWREVMTTNSSTNPGHPVETVHIDGIIYLISETNKPHIVAFDVATESLTMIPNTITFPYDDLRFFRSPHVTSSSWVELNGRLAFIYIFPERSKIDIWALKESMECEKHEVSLPSEENKIISQSDFISFTTNSMGEIVFLIQATSSMPPLILLYAFKRQVWRKFEICGLHDHLHFSNRLVSSLVHAQESVCFHD